MAKFQFYKRNQGKHTRILTFSSVILAGIVGAVVLGEKLAAYALTSSTVIRFGVPAVLVFALGVLMLWLVNRPKTADFLIATEGDRKSVV